MPNTKAIEVSIQTRVIQAIKQTDVVSTVLAIQKTANHESIKASKPTSTHTSTAPEVSTPTQTPSPSLTPSSTPTLTPTETSTASRVGIIPENVIFFYLTLLGTGGSVGCGDSLVKISTGQYRSGDVAKDLKIALDAIFMTGQYFGGAFNATYPSRLTVGSLDLNKDGTALVYFSGYYEKPADSCDASRYRSQVWATALQFKEISRFIPYVGNSLLGDRLAVYSDSGK